jgi:hypothetical protein
MIILLKVIGLWLELMQGLLCLLYPKKPAGIVYRLCNERRHLMGVVLPMMIPLQRAAYNSEITLETSQANIR